MPNGQDVGGAELERVERLRGRRRIEHWAQPNPFKGFRLKPTASFPRREIGFDAGMNTVAQPKIIGRPCFAQPAFYVRSGFGQVLKKVDRRGQLQWTRCGRCNIKEICFDICDRRLNAAGARDAVKQFKGEGGAVALAERKASPGVKRAFEAVVRKLIDYGDFTSVNDQWVVEHYDEAQKARLRKDAARKQAVRLAKVAAGQLDEQALDLLRRHRIFREDALRQIKISQPTGLHPSISKMPLESVATTADAWHARETLVAQRKPCGPSAVAGMMIHANPSRYPPASHNALRQRVKADLERCDRLESTVPRGRSEPVWPKFDLVAELRYEKSMTPYMD